jgi:signal transduction histidine kinase
MIKLKDLYSLIEENYVFLMAVDANENILYASPHLKLNMFPPELEADPLPLAQVLQPSSLDSFRKALAISKEGKKGTRAVLQSRLENSSPQPMHIRCFETSEGKICLFIGAQIDALSRFSTTDKAERIKELSCLYSVSEWIEISSSIDEFFQKLPEHIAPGMRLPEEAVIYAEYNGVEYGQEPDKGSPISVVLKVNYQEKGSIVVGYLTDGQEMLPEEQKMLNEIGRVLNLALEKKEMAQRVALTREEEEKHRLHLHKLEADIERREAEMEEQRQKLSTAKSYLTRANRTWTETSNRLDTMFKAIPDEVMLIDLNLNVVMSNQDGIKPGEKCYRAYFNRNTPCEDCRIKSIVKDKTPITTYMRKDEKHLQLHTLPVFNDNEEVDGILEFYRDVTLEKTYEQQIQQADKLASLGQLVSGIGHEINNPNQFIRGNVKIVKQAFEDIMPIMDKHAEENPDLKIARLPYGFFKDHIMTLIDDMSHGSERIKGIVDGLRSFARRDEGQLIDTVDINTLIGATARLVETEVHKRAEIELNLATDLPSFKGNSQKIEQVLVNLIVNAAQAIPDDKKGLVKVTTCKDAQNISVQVCDNGKGIDNKTRKQIFDPFFTTKRTKGGTGLGLSISYRIIEEHGGTISVDSEVDRGTTFTILLPINETEEAK